MSEYIIYNELSNERGKNLILRPDRNGNVDFSRSFEKTSLRTGSNEN